MYKVSDSVLWDSHNIIDKLIESLEFFADNPEDRELIADAKQHQKLLRDEFLDIKG